MRRRKYLLHSFFTNQITISNEQYKSVLFVVVHRSVE